jgi:hypothetical protein
MIVLIELHENEHEQRIHEMFEIWMMDQRKNLILGKNDLMQQQRY